MKKYLDFIKENIEIKLNNISDADLQKILPFIPNIYELQDQDAERIISFKWDGEGANVWRYKFENAGDILRELAKYKNKFLDPGYIYEKVDKINNFIKEFKDDDVHPYDKYSTLKTTNKENLEKLRNAYIKLPTLSKAQDVAKALILNLIDGDLYAAKDKINYFLELKKGDARENLMNANKYRIYDEYKKSKEKGDNPELIKAVENILNENKFQDKALDNISKVGGFNNLGDLDKLILLSDSNDIEKLKKLSLRKIYTENGGTFGYLNIKVKIKDINEQEYDHEFSKEFAGKEGWLFPYINYLDSIPYVNVRFDLFVKNDVLVGGGSYVERPILLYNMYPLAYSETIKDFKLFDDMVKREREDLNSLDENNSTIPFDDEILSELINLYKQKSRYKINVEDRCKELLNLHNKWLEKARTFYSAQEIAEKLIKYEKNLGNL